MRGATPSAIAPVVPAVLRCALIVISRPAAAEAKTKRRGRADFVLIAHGAGFGQRYGSQRVRAPQHRLLQAGARPGPIVGRFGPQTEAAIRRFQRREEFAVDGVAGEATREVLARGVAALAPKRRRLRAAGPEKFTAKPPSLPNAREPDSAEIGKAQPAANADGAGAMVADKVAVLAAAALALLLARASAVTLRRRQNRRRAHAPVGYQLLGVAPDCQPSPPEGSPSQSRSSPALGRNPDDEDALATPCSFRQAVATSRRSWGTRASSQEIRGSTTMSSQNRWRGRYATATGAAMGSIENCSPWLDLKFSS
jgi:peptidoglycan hydrolase-like protein with peptidoglycan-binding domain